MADQACDNCGELFKHDEVVEAHVLTHFRLLKAKRIYAVEKPEECLRMIHYPECPRV